MATNNPKPTDGNQNGFPKYSSFTMNGHCGFIEETATTVAIVTSIAKGAIMVVIPLAEKQSLCESFPAIAKAIPSTFQAYKTALDACKNRIFEHGKAIDTTRKPKQR